MKLLTVDTLDEARKKILDRARVWKVPSERIKIEEAADRTLADDMYSPCDIPGFDRATVDGYAVVASDTAGAGESIPVFLSLVGEVAMGEETALCLQPGQCASVPTGGMLPKGADAVVMLEYSEAFDERSIAVYEAAAPGTGMVHSGEDVKRGSLLLAQGTRLRAQELGVLAAAGISEAAVYRPFPVTVISTGDELVAPNKEPGAGEVRDINTIALCSLARRSGYRVVKNMVLPDDDELLETTVRRAMAESSVVAVSGGSSQGEKDATAAVFERIAKPGILTHGLALKPGKPTILAWDSETQTLLAGLPGHPVSAMMVFRLLLGWLAATLTGAKGEFPIPARISCNIAASPGKTSCQPVALRLDESGFIAEPVFGKSGMISALTRADGYIIIAMNTEGLAKDEPVLVHLF